MLFLLVKSADQRDGVTSVMVEYVTECIHVDTLTQSKLLELTIQETTACALEIFASMNKFLFRQRRSQFSSVSRF
jgi:hypothetical protein